MLVRGDGRSATDRNTTLCIGRGVVRSFASLVARVRATAAAIRSCAAASSVPTTAIVANDAASSAIAFTCGSRSSSDGVGWRWSSRTSFTKVHHRGPPGVRLHTRRDALLRDVSCALRDGHTPPTRRLDRPRRGRAHAARPGRDRLGDGGAPGRRRGHRPADRADAAQRGLGGGRFLSRTHAVGDPTRPRPPSRCS